VKLLLDEMLSPEIAAQLRRRGHDAVAVGERTDLRAQSDAIIFARAQREGRAIVTENVSDFRPLASFELQQGRSCPGLIFMTNRRFPRNDPRTAGRLVTALNDLLSTTLGPADPETWLV